MELSEVSLLCWALSYTFSSYPASGTTGCPKYRRQMKEWINGHVIKWKKGQMDNEKQPPIQEQEKDQSTENQQLSVLLFPGAQDKELAAHGPKQPKKQLSHMQMTRDRLSGSQGSRGPRESLCLVTRAAWTSNCLHASHANVEACKSPLILHTF